MYLSVSTSYVEQRPAPLRPPATSSPPLPWTSLPDWFLPNCHLYNTKQCCECELGIHVMCANWPQLRFNFLLYCLKAEIFFPYEIPLECIGTFSCFHCTPDVFWVDLILSLFSMPSHLPCVCPFFWLPIFPPSAFPFSSTNKVWQLEM